MKIEFNSILPHPIQLEKLSQTSIWNNNFEISTPEKIILKAESGKGKSTFIHLIFGLRNDYAGDILIDGINIKEINAEKWSEIRKGKLSIIFQDLQLFDQLTAWENIQIKNSLTNHFTDEKIEFLLEKLGMFDYKNQLAKTLSYGQKQRIAIIRALAQPFEMILLDEPFSHLDKENEKKAFNLILEECENNKAGFVLTSLNSNQIIEFNKTLLL